MAKNTLPVNFQDDIMNSAMDGKRRYKMINNSDGTVSLEDVTTYDQVGSNFGAGQMNATNAAVNESADKNRVIQDIEAIRNVTEDGYIAGALALKQVDDSLGGNILIYNESEDAYYIQNGADSVPKKLGEPTVVITSASLGYKSGGDYTFPVNYTTGYVSHSFNAPKRNGKYPAAIYLQSVSVQYRHDSKIDFATITTSVKYTFGDSTFTITHNTNDMDGNIGPYGTLNFVYVD